MTAASPALERFLARLLRRSTLTSVQRQAILELPHRVVRVPSRADISSAGQTLSHACLIGSGLVARFDEMRDGQRQIAALHIAGDMADLHSVVAPTRPWGLTALSESIVLQVPHEPLRELACAHPDVALAFWRDCTVDFSVVSKWVGNLGRQGARGRLAHLLCEMGVRFELAGLGTRTSFALEATQEQLADALGLTSVHVNRTLQSLRRDELVVMRNHLVEVLDWERLADVADFDPSYLLTDVPPGRSENSG